MSLTVTSLSPALHTPHDAAGEGDQLRLPDARQVRGRVPPDVGHLHPGVAAAPAAAQLQAPLVKLVAAPEVDEELPGGLVTHPEVLLALHTHITLGTGHTIHTVYTTGMLGAGEDGLPLLVVVLKVSR